MYSGNRSASSARTVGRIGGPGDITHQPLITGTVLAGDHLRLLHPIAPANAACTSPSSMRYPRILTCSSARPTYRSCPSAPHHTTSPVRYIRAPGAPNGHATNRDAVNPARPTYPYANPAPATYNSPDHPRRHRPQPPIQHKKAQMGQRHPDRADRAVDVTVDDLPERGMHRRLGDAIHIDQPRQARMICPATSQDAAAPALPRRTPPPPA